MKMAMDLFTAEAEKIQRDLEVMRVNPLELEGRTSAIEIAEAEPLVEGKDLVMGGVDFKVDCDHSTHFGSVQNRSQEGGTDAARACCWRDVKFFKRANETAVFRAE